MKCEAELCPNWTGNGCICAVMQLPGPIQGALAVREGTLEEVSDEAFARRNADFLNMDWLD